MFYDSIASCVLSMSPGILGWFSTLGHGKSWCLLSQKGDNLTLYVISTWIKQWTKPPVSGFYVCRYCSALFHNTQTRVPIKGKKTLSSSYAAEFWNVLTSANQNQNSEQVKLSEWFIFLILTREKVIEMDFLGTLVLGSVTIVAVILFRCHKCAIGLHYYYEGIKKWWTESYQNYLPPLFLSLQLISLLTIWNVSSKNILREVHHLSWLSSPLHWLLLGWLNSWNEFSQSLMNNSGFRILLNLQTTLENKMCRMLTYYDLLKSNAMGPSFLP